MNSSAQGRLDKIPPQYEAIKPLLTAVCLKYGDRWAYPFVVGRNILLDMFRKTGEVDEQEFWSRFEDRLANPPPPRKIHIFRLPQNH